MIMIWGEGESCLLGRDEVDSVGVTIFLDIDE